MCASTGWGIDGDNELDLHDENLNLVLNFTTCFIESSGANCIDTIMIRMSLYRHILNEELHPRMDYISSVLIALNPVYLICDSIKAIMRYLFSDIRTLSGIMTVDTFDTHLGPKVQEQ